MSTCSADSGDPWRLTVSPETEKSLSLSDTAELAVNLTDLLVGFESVGYRCRFIFHHCRGHSSLDDRVSDTDAFLRTQ